MKCAGIEFVTSDRIEAQELARSCSWAEILTALCEQTGTSKKNEQKKLLVVRNTTRRLFWALCTETAQEPELTSGGLVRVPHALPLGYLNLYAGGVI